MANTRANLFFLLAIVGLISQLALFGAFLADSGLDLGAMVDQMFDSPMAAVASADLLMCGVAYLVWMPREARRLGIESAWPYGVAVLGGLCFAYPLFLAARERRRAEARA